MQFKRVGRDIIGVQFSRAEQKAIDAEILRQTEESDRRYFLDMSSALLLTLHRTQEFGAKRLKAFWQEFQKEHDKLLEDYGSGSDYRGREEIAKILKMSMEDLVDSK